MNALLFQYFRPPAAAPRGLHEGPMPCAGHAPGMRGACARGAVWLAIPQKHQNINKTKNQTNIVKPQRVVPPQRVLIPQRLQYSTTVKKLKPIKNNHKINTVT